MTDKLLIDRTLLEQALEALETCDAAHISDGGRQWYDDKAVEEAITALRAALAQQPEPVQEPVAYIHRQGKYWEASERFLTDDEKARGWTEEPLYTNPPQRPRLTDEEIRAHADKHLRYQPESYEASGVFALARAIERKVRGE